MKIAHVVQKPIISIICYPELVGDILLSVIENFFRRFRRRGEKPPSPPGSEPAAPEDQEPSNVIRKLVADLIRTRTDEEKPVKDVTFLGFDSREEVINEVKFFLADGIRIKYMEGKNAWKVEFVTTYSENRFAHKFSDPYINATMEVPVTPSGRVILRVREQNFDESEGVSVFSSAEVGDANWEKYVGKLQAALVHRKT